MKRQRKGCIIILIITLLLLIVLIYRYSQSLILYYKFNSEICLQTDTIFRGDKTQNSYMPLEFNETTRLYYLCKIWGFLKYYSEDIYLSSARLDSMLLATIPHVLVSQTKQDYCYILERLISTSQHSEMIKNPYRDLRDYYLIDNNWMNDTINLNADIKNKLELLFSFHSGKDNKFVFNKSTGNIRIINEIKYPKFPKEENVRLLGLFHYWNVINYFYVYKNYIDDNWDKVLYESIPRFRNAKTNRNYRMEIYRLTNRLRDTHTSFPVTIDIDVFGPYRPNFRMMLINDTFIINKIRIPEYKKENFQVGDIVLQVDGEDIYQLSDSLSNFVSGGNNWSDQLFLCNAILSRQDSTTLFTLLRDKDTLSVRSINHKVFGMNKREREKNKENEKQQLYKWINDSIAYFNLSAATKSNFNRNYQAVKSASTILLDMRCYPQVDLILPLTDKFVPSIPFFAYNVYPDTRFPGMVRYTKSSKKIGSDNYYRGNIIVLVNEWTQSFSEYAVMALQTNPKTKIIGNYSSGVDGNITTFEFPGRIKTIYSGIGIYYPDFSQTQRRGVHLDYVVEPTLEYIKKNVDIAYETAVHIAKRGNL